MNCIVAKALEFVCMYRLCGYECDARRDRWTFFMQHRRPNVVHENMVRDRQCVES